jgi:hypothetical protein
MYYDYYYWQVWLNGAGGEVQFLLSVTGRQPFPVPAKRHAAPVPDKQEGAYKYPSYVKQVYTSLWCGT